MKRPVKLGIATLKALGTFLALGAAAHAGMPYLPLIGPPPLRVQVIRPRAAAVVQFVPTPAAVAATTNSPALAANPVPAATNAIPPVTAFMGPAIPSPDSVPDNSFATSMFALPTTDLLGITPQMLATYFRPVQLGTNAPLAGILQVNFMPPLLPPTPPPDKSSHAEYIVK